MKRTIHNIPPDYVEEFDAIIPNARKKLEIPVEPAMPCVARKRFLTTKTQNTHKVAVSKVGGERPQALCEGRQRKGKKKRSIQKGVFLHNGRNCLHQDHVADRRFVHGIITIWYRHLCQQAKPRNIQQQNKLHWTEDGASYNNYQRGLRQRSKREQDVINDAKVNDRNVHFTTRMDLCHLKH